MTGDLIVAGVAHFHHQLRGVDADDDEAFCRNLAVTLGLPIEVGRADVPRAAQQAGRSIEDMARELRYRSSRPLRIGCAQTRLRSGTRSTTRRKRFCFGSSAVPARRSFGNSPASRSRHPAAYRDVRTIFATTREGGDWGHETIRAIGI